MSRRQCKMTDPIVELEDIILEVYKWNKVRGRLNTIRGRKPLRMDTLDRVLKSLKYCREELYYHHTEFMEPMIYNGEVIHDHTTSPVINESYTVEDFNNGVQYDHTFD